MQMPLDLSKNVQNSWQNLLDLMGSEPAEDIVNRLRVTRLFWADEDLERAARHVDRRQARDKARQRVLAEGGSW